METALDTSTKVQRKALTRKFAPGLLRPLSGMNVSVRLGEIAKTILSRWGIPPQPAKPTSTLNFCYLTVCDRAHWLMLRESLLSLYRSWNSLPELTVVSDGSWKADEFAEVFAWWPAPIGVLTREEICTSAFCAGFPELGEYARKSAYGLKLATIVTQAREQRVLFVDADILWFRDPALLLGDSESWEKIRAVRERNCHQHRDMAMRHCAQVLEPPFVNSGIVALHGDLMTPALLRNMVQDALPHPKDSSCEQTIIATAVKHGGEFFPEKLSLVEFDDVDRFRSRNMKVEGYHSRHYVNWMRHLFYRDALKLRWHRSRLATDCTTEEQCAALHQNDSA
jgi:Nucleotide-diphospho-sugar transferase